MKKFKGILNRLKNREKALIIAILIICSILVVNKFIIRPSFDSLNEVRLKYESKSLLLGKYYDFMANEKWYSENLDLLEADFKLLEGKILKFGTEELASAKLQELVKNIAKRNGLTISRSIASKKRVVSEEPYLAAISANFEINDVNSIKNLSAFLYDLEYNDDKLFFVNDIKVKGIGVDVISGVSISTTLAIIASIDKR